MGAQQVGLQCSNQRLAGHDSCAHGAAMLCPVIKPQLQQKPSRCRTAGVKRQHHGMQQVLTCVSCVVLVVEAEQPWQVSYTALWHSSNIDESNIVQPAANSLLCCLALAAPADLNLVS